MNTAMVGRAALLTAIASVLVSSGCSGAPLIPITVENGCGDRPIEVAAQDASFLYDRDLNWVRIAGGEQSLVAELTLARNAIILYIGYPPGPYQDHYIVEDDLEPLVGGGYIVRAIDEVLCPVDESGEWRTEW